MLVSRNLHKQQPPAVARELQDRGLRWSLRDTEYWACETRKFFTGRPSVHAAWHEDAWNKTALNGMICGNVFSWSQLEKSSLGATKIDVCGEEGNQSNDAVAKTLGQECQLLRQFLYLLNIGVWECQMCPS